MREWLKRFDDQVWKNQRRMIIAWLAIAVAVVAIAVSEDVNDARFVAPVVVAFLGALLFKFVPLAAGLPAVSAFVAAGLLHSPTASSYLPVAVLFAGLGVWRYLRLRTGQARK